MRADAREGSRPLRPSSFLRIGTLAVAALLGSSFPAFAQPLALDIAQAGVAYDQRTGEPVVTFRWAEPSIRLFAEFTARNVGRRFAIRVDGRVVTTLVIREPILGDTGQIAGGFTVDRARQLADRLSSGTGKVEVEVVAD
jgi:preprotein translocase subunit SecD